MKILVILPRFPYPLEKGDKLRAYYQIKELSKHNEVYLFCAAELESFYLGCNFCRCGEAADLRFTLR